jgi:hypothetical protein
MALVYNWQKIVKRAWSLRLSAAAFLFGGAELVLPLFVDCCPRYLFASLSLAALAGSMVTRVLSQKGFYRE